VTPSRGDTRIQSISLWPNFNLERTLDKRRGKMGVVETTGKKVRHFAEGDD